MSTQPIFNKFLKRINGRGPKQQDCYEPRHLERSIHRAFQNFARQHPLYANSLFDEHFLLKTLVSPKAPKDQPAKLPSADELTEAWAAQFLVKGSQDSLKKARSIAADFLGYLKNECSQLK